jgi:hypothetical protein
MNQMGLSLQLLCHADKGGDTFKRIVTGDESSLPTQINASFNVMETSQLTFNVNV